MTKSRESIMLFGTFDILHAGHVDLFRQAKKIGNYVIVVVARDKNVKSIKKRNALHTEKERAHMLEHIRLVDEVYLGNLNDPYAAIKKYKPDYILLGYDQKKFVNELEEVLEGHNLETKVVRAKAYKPKKYKSSIIRNKLVKEI